MKTPLICTADHPYGSGSDIPGHTWVHPRAVCVRSSDYHDHYRCPVCDVRFSVEVGD